MNEQEKTYFEELTQSRSEIADALDNPAVEGLKSVITDKYSDQAHFIYELLQNADDAEATSARFILESDRLIFAHNGKRHFSISSLKTEREDSQSGKLGDVNAITSIANSNKSEAKIGKFGIGFKAVFQYTSTPYIYDKDFAFKIERLIVPVLVEDCCPLRNEDETLFIFPFDLPERSAQEAYQDIADKLKRLSYPLLFLSNLRYIEFQINESENESPTLGLYEKSTEKTFEKNNITAELICLTQNDGEDIYDEHLWLFSRMDENNLRYSVGFFLQEDGHLKPANLPAFCFFPTKETTGLHFIIHAPFQLTDSRESIFAGNKHNTQMIEKLAELASDAMLLLRDLGKGQPVRLIDDQIISIIPIDPESFNAVEDKDRISFYPFYQSIKHKFETEELLPASEGYVSTENAYWASASQLTLLFSNAQLAMITGNEHARWVFESLGRNEIQRTNRPLFRYIDSLVRTYLDESAIINGRLERTYYDRDLGMTRSIEKIKGITSEYTEAQSFDWLHSFYQWISESMQRIEDAKYRPVFLDQYGKATAAFDEKNNAILFLPVENATGYTFVHPKILENQETKKFMENIGIEEPTLMDQIYNIILPQYQSIFSEPDIDSHFKIFFKYYCSSTSTEQKNLIDNIKDCPFLVYLDKDGNQYKGTASTMYLPSEEAEAFLETKIDTRFIDFNKYKSLVPAENESNLRAFLVDLGIKDGLQIIKRKTGPDERDDLPHPQTARGNEDTITWTETILEGCEEILGYIETHADSNKSILLWNCLMKLIETRCAPTRQLDIILFGSCEYFYSRPREEPFTSSDLLLLRNRKWMMDSSGNFMAPNQLYADTISDLYDTSSVYAAKLMESLGVNTWKIADQNLSDEQRNDIALAALLKSRGYTNPEDIEELLAYIDQKEAEQSQEPELKKNEVPANNENPPVKTSEEGPSSSRHERQETNKNTSSIINNIEQLVNKKGFSSDNTDPLNLDSDEDEDLEADEDEYTPPPVDYSKKIQRETEKSATEISKIIHFDELQNKATAAERYSFEWFTTLLEMESLNSGEANPDSREISISFASVAREPDTDRTLILRHPDRHIPQFMEELADIPLILHMGEKEKLVPIEVASVNSYTLRVKVKKGTDIEDIDFSDVTEATINAQSPVFLIEELRRQFAALDYPDGFNMQENLCSNIDFIFGPPGTGKTTYLAKNILIPLIEELEECKVLVLTPTNKAADVFVQRIMEAYGEDTSYEDWLIRFGSTGDESIEDSPVFKDKTFDIRSCPKSVTVTTIARFPYDYFMPQGDRLYLLNLNWDYIIFDEASMIPIADIVLPLYRKTPKKFIVAGDPFQIEPIVSVNLWKSENIYTMIQLKSFENPTTSPHEYDVKLLTTQYRSVPNIGKIYSELTYGGVLHHQRSAESQRLLNLGPDLSIKTLNLIKFPVQKYESIYKCKRLNKSSPYQIYSALFTFEYVNFISKLLSQKNPDAEFKIGIIAPYRAQADIIDRLFASERLPKQIDVQIGTIHSFQGDECDILFALFNPPPKISDKNELFLNKKNIINVSISRARDYLFIVMPDDNTENIRQLKLVKRVEQLIKSTDDWSELPSQDLEALMFNDPMFLENNTFSTSHQSVNIYTLPEKCYEVRSEDSAVDVQIHKRPSEKQGNTIDTVPSEQID